MTDGPRICILDYGMGNLRSVEKALERVGCRAVISADHELASACDGLILPGVGAFAKARERIGELELDRLIAERVEAGTPVLGICLGFQLLFGSSTELGGAEGLGLIHGEVVGLDAPGLKVPHIGWERVEWTAESELVDGIESGTPFYFVHSFAPRKVDEEELLGTAVHGREFACAVAAPADLRRAVSPREVQRRGAAPARELRVHLRPRRRRGSRLILYPAIDIRGGAAVRLVQGDYDRETAFDADPLDAAMRWVEQGARALHVVDLDGAREGAPVNIEHVGRICDAVEVPVQVGGGLREAGDVEAVLAAGAARAVLGTAALSDPALVEALAAEHGGRIVVSADARGGNVAVQGWERDTGAAVAPVIADLARRGIGRFVFTPVEVDGTLEGPGLDELRTVAAAASEAGAELIYSGGIGTVEHLRALAAEALPAVIGVIVGRALYEAGSRSPRARPPSMRAELDPVLGERQPEVRVGPLAVDLPAAALVERAGASVCGGREQPRALVSLIDHRLQRAAMQLAGELAAPVRGAHEQLP